MITRGSQPFFHPGLDHTALPCPVLWGQIKTPALRIGLSKALSPRFRPPAPALPRACLISPLGPPHRGPVSVPTDDSCGSAWNLSVLCLSSSQLETLGSLFGRCSELRDPGSFLSLRVTYSHRHPAGLCVQTLSFTDRVSPCPTREEARL